MIKFITSARRIDVLAKSTLALCLTASYAVGAPSPQQPSQAKQQPAKESVPPPTAKDGAPRPKKKLASGSGFGQYAGREASSRLIAGAATRAPADTAAPHHERGLELYEAGQYREAIAEFKQALHLKPSLAEAQFGLGLTYGELGEYMEAVAAFKQLLQTKADDDLRILTHYEMGNVYMDAEQYREAAEAYRQVINLNPDLSKPHYNLGIALIGAGQQKEAIEAFKEAIRLKPEYAQAQFNLALAYLDTGNREAAQAHYEILKKLNPELANQLHSAFTK